MPQKAHVTALDALEAFRASLVVYVSQARPALEEVSADVMRTRSWLENEKRTYWENELRRRRKELEQAQQALFSARLGSLRQETAAELMAVQRAKRAVDEAETKLRVLKRWNREFEGRVQPLVKQMEKLHTLLSNDLVKATAYLTQAITTLADYAQAKPALASTPTVSASGQEGQAPAGDSAANAVTGPVSTGAGKGVGE